MHKECNIKSDCGRYLLSALITEKGFEMASFSKEEELDFENEIWIDNPNFIIFTLLPAAKEAISKKINLHMSFEREDDQTSEEPDINIPLDDLQEIVDMIEEGNKMGFFLIPF